MPNQNYVSVSNTSPLEHIIEIGIDKLKICLPSSCAEEGFRDHLGRTFDLLAKKTEVRKYSSQRKAFKRRLHVRVSGKYILVECDPNSDTHPWCLTAEFNPNDFLRQGAKAVKNLEKFFRMLFGYESVRLLPQVVVRTLHVNIDYDICPLDGTLVSVKGKRGGAKVLWNFNGSSTPESLYIGAMHSDRRVVMYNKAAELLHQEFEKQASDVLSALASSNWGPTVKRIRDKVSDVEHWRLEVRCETKKVVPVSNIASFASCCEGICFFQLPADAKPFNTSLGRLFIATARSDGLHAALNLLETNEARRFKRAFANMRSVAWFDSDILRQAIEQAIGKLSPLFAPPTIRLREQSASNSGTGLEQKASREVKFTRPRSSMRAQPKLVKNDTKAQPPRIG